MAEPSNGPAAYVWKGRPLATIGDLVDAMAALQTAEEAQEFITGYREISPHADANAGYVTGYLGAHDAERLRKWMGTPHPIFGMSNPSPEDALVAGMRRGTEARDAG